MNLDQETGTSARRLRRAGVALALTIAVLGTLFPRDTAVAQGRPIKVTLVQNLDFGVIGVPNTTGTATILPNGAKQVSAGILDLGGVSAPAVFLVQGERLTFFSIDLPASGTVTLPGGPAAILSDFQSSPAITGQLDNAGKATVTVGATMHLDPGLWEGVYTDPFDIIATYQ